MPPNSQSFTSAATAGGLLNVLKNRCAISQAFDPASGRARPPIAEFDAIWDTGATGSVITQQVVDACGLAPIGMAQIHGFDTVSVSEVYLVNIYLPNHVAFVHVHVVKGKLAPGTDMLIGMDIINQGDFAVTNLGGVTKFSFRVPSETHIDFVAEHNQRILREQFKHGGSKKNRKERPKKHGKHKK